MVTRGLVLILAALVRRAFAVFVVAALRESWGGAGQEAERSQGEKEVFHKKDGIK